MNISKENLQHLYITLKLSTRETAKRLGCSSTTVIRHLKKHNIPTRSTSESLKGEKNPMYGKSHSPETKAAIAHKAKESMTEERKNKYSKMFTGDNNPMYGKSHTTETKKVMSQLQRQRFSNPKEKEKTSNATKAAMQHPATRNKISNFAKSRVGPLNSFYGKSHTKETKNKISQANKGRFVGSKGSNWRGGKTALSHKIRNCDQYLEWRHSIFKRDNYICQNCGQRGGKLCVDHIKPFSLIIIEHKITSLDEAIDCSPLWDTNNGKTLCRSCHKKTPTYGWGSYWIKIYNSHSNRNV